MAVEAGSQPPSSDATVSRRRARPSVTSLIGLGLLFLVGVWLVGNLVEDPSDFFTVFIIGMTTGAIYGLVALGYTLVYGILQLINFAHGDVFALSGLFASTLILSLFDLTQESAALVLVGGLVATLLITMAFGAGSTRHRARRLPASAPGSPSGGSDHRGGHVLHRSEHLARDLRRQLPPRPAPDPSLGRVLDRGVAVQWNKLGVILATIPVFWPSPTSSARRDKARRCARPPKTLTPRG